MKAESSEKIPESRLKTKSLAVCNISSNLLCFDCLILDCHGSGATHCYGDEDFMGQCKRLARKVHKNTLELRMIMRWLLRVRHPDLND